MTTAAANPMPVRRSHAVNGRPSALKRFARQMSIPTPARLRSPFRLRWWEWGKVMGIIALVALAILYVTGHVPHPVAVGVLLHITLDFTLQSSETCLCKDRRGRHLLVHALAAGGVPLAVAGLVTGNPTAVIAWAAAGVASHYAVDWTHKFGLRREALAALADQACHLATVLVLTGQH